MTISDTALLPPAIELALKSMHEEFNKECGIEHSIYDLLGHIVDHGDHHARSKMCTLFSLYPEIMTAFFSGEQREYVGQTAFSLIKLLSHEGNRGFNMDSIADGRRIEMRLCGEDFWLLQEDTTYTVDERLAEALVEKLKAYPATLGASFYDVPIVGDMPGMSNRLVDLVREELPTTVA